MRPSACLALGASVSSVYGQGNRVDSTRVRAGMAQDGPRLERLRLVGQLRGPLAFIW